MSSARITGLKATQITPLCQLQDLGRFGYKNFGVTHGGAIDPDNLRIANLLVGNLQSEACLELTLAGAEFIITSSSMRVAFAGDFPISINGKEQPNYCSLRLLEGDVLTIGAANKQIRGYLAVAGGFYAKNELGSSSSHIRSGLGGFFEPMAPQTVLPTNLSFAAKGYEYFLREGLRRRNNDIIRVVPGPQAEYFTDNGISDFYSHTFTIANDSDRMGYRLEGNVIEHALDGNIISDPTLPGSVQIPPSGNPVVLMADGPTTGGYPKIATIASTDLAMLAQKGPGTKFQFKAISVKRAQALLRQQQAFFATLNLRLDRS